MVNGDVKFDRAKLQDLAKHIENRVKSYHQSLRPPAGMPPVGIALTSELWECVLTYSLHDVGARTLWKPGSHAVGKDIRTNFLAGTGEMQERISCKSGSFKMTKQGVNKGRETIEISGPRTQSYKTLKEKLNHLSQSHDDYYFALSKYVNQIKQGNYQYRLGVFPSSLVKPLPLKYWNEEHSNTQMKSEGEGIVQTINKAMSCQLWTTIDSDKIEYWFDINGN